MINIQAIYDKLFVMFSKIFIVHDVYGHPIYHSTRQLRRDILTYYKKNPTTDSYLIDSIKFIRKHCISVAFPHAFRINYKFKDIDIQYDEDGTPFYITDEHKKLFLHADEKINSQKLVNSLLIEQDVQSPHRYLSDSFNVGPEDVLVDVGSAEGILSLQLVDKVKHVYLFECEDKWISALNKTFAPWKDKVTIVEKYVSNVDGDKTIRLDTFFKTQSLLPTFIKLDVEGAEEQVLEGMGELWNSNSLRIACCTYHRQNQYEQVKEIFENHHAQIEVVPGYMAPCMNKLEPPYFRHALIRATVTSR